MTVGEFVGFLAALLTFTTFYMKTMVPLRVVGILSNASFLTYALVVPLAAYNTPEDAENCPIGAAAWVDFPEIDCIDELRARLRL